jgi:hypothetical protein
MHRLRHTRRLGQICPVLWLWDTSHARPKLSSEFRVHRKGKTLILETVSDYADLLGGPETLRRNLALSEIRMDLASPDGSFNASYAPGTMRITLAPEWYIGSIHMLPGGRRFVFGAQPCVEELLDFPEGSLPTVEYGAKFVLAHEMGHAFHTGNPRALRSFTNRVNLPWSILAGCNPNPIIARNAGRDGFTREVFADTLAAFLYSPNLLNQQMLNWIQNDLPGVVR